MNLSINTVEEHIKSSMSVKNSILKSEKLKQQILMVGNICIETYKAGNKVILAGNGGSAADAQHIAAEFVSRFRFDRPGLPSLSLSTDTSMITAIGNDYGFEKLFVRQLQANAQSGDVFIGISTSGTSKNVVEAMKTCSELGITSVAFTGQSGGDLKEVSEYCLCVPSDSTAFVQESHIMIGHIICGFVEDALFGEL